jgi:beta-glucuronidase
MGVVERMTQIRTFQQHVLRPTKLLDGQWTFAADQMDEGRTQGWSHGLPEGHHTYVPSCWNNEMGWYHYEGIVWYATSFVPAKPGPIKLIFHGILGQAEVYVDGEKQGEHYGGFTSFELVLPRIAAGKHTLVIRTDNTHTDQTLPLEKVDWFHYGGIIRSVELQELADVYIEKCVIDYKLDVSSLTAQLTVNSTLRSFSDKDEEMPIEVRLGERMAAAETVRVPAGASVQWASAFQENDVRLWNIEDSQLYTVRVATQEDDWSDRIGFRNIETRDKKIWINGKPAYFQGINRHEEHPEWGFAFPPKLMQKDLDIIKRMGCNSVRGSHYPQSQYWIDLLDEQGISFWSELPLWGYAPHNMEDPVVITRSLQMLEEMIEQYRHHPSIIFWSVNNECATEKPEGVAFNRLLTNRVRELDNTRLVTFATFKPLIDLTLDMFDVIGVNKYFGWYGGKVEQFAEFMDRFHKYARSQGVGDKPVLMTEFGGAGIFGDVGWEEERMFSEDYQASILQEALRIFRADPQISGTFVWQFADIRSDTPRFRDRARGFNNKGVVNEFRKPKLAYRVVKDAYAAPLPHRLAPLDR